MTSIIRIKPRTPEEIAEKLDQAEQVCQARSARLTPLRRLVLELIIRIARPVGAYELLDELNKQGRSSGPPTVYRSLEFLTEMGLIHRLPTQNAYIACSHPAEHHTGLILSCERCGQALELDTPEVTQAIQDCAKPQGFSVHGNAIEVTGICPYCRDSS